MRITKLKIDNWRNFENIEINPPEDSSMIVLVGENGSGKSNILELVYSSLNLLGVSSELEIQRGNPTAEKHAFEICFRLSQPIADMAKSELGKRFSTASEGWDHTITLASSRNEEDQHKFGWRAGGIEDNGAVKQLIKIIKAIFHNSDDIHFLWIDADRAYHAFHIDQNQVAQGLVTDWDNPRVMKKGAHNSCRTKYEEWIRYCIGLEAKAATRHATEHRKAKRSGSVEPTYSDCFARYSELVKKVLPHIDFYGIEFDKQPGGLLYHTADEPISFFSMSGGEREIAFIIGQIERFRMRNGLLLIDEPDLHLHPDLVRKWMTFLRDTIDEGQVWIATHSMEAVEAAGPENTFVLERPPGHQLVSKVALLSSKPALSYLSGVVGSPAFALEKKRFLFIEGDRQGTERDLVLRLLSLVGDIEDVRVLEGGGCSEISRKVSACRELAVETDEQLHVGGVVDRDFRTDDQLQRIAKSEVFILPFHEIENIFLHPLALAHFVGKSGLPYPPEELLRSAVECFTGTAVLERARMLMDYSEQFNRDLRVFAGEFGSWQKLSSDFESNLGILVSKFECSEDKEKETLKECVRQSAKWFEVALGSDELWMTCPGKEVLGVVAQQLGFKDKRTMVKYVIHAWRDEELPVPTELRDIWGYIQAC